ncbi:hypothetical protein P3J6_120615 [Pseudoalteromonas sp. 3J6]|nr:hypothetical protein P3J6_120615 [Pseudoalteromonas sp. 3J6]
MNEANNTIHIKLKMRFRNYILVSLYLIVDIPTSYTRGKC